MEIEKMMQSALERLENRIEKIPNTPISLKSSKSDEQRKDDLRREIPTLLENYQIPRRFIRPDLSLPASIPRRFEAGLCLTGKPGVGKTTSLCLLARLWLDLRAENGAGDSWGRFSRGAWLFISFPEFIMRLQDSFRTKNNDETAYRMLSGIAEKQYLIIDDLGAEKPSDYVRQATYFIINHREMHMLPTFISTNFSMDHLNENIDPRISSRICGMGEVIRMEGDDLRMKK